VKILHRYTGEVILDTGNEVDTTFTEMHLVGACFTNISFTDQVAFFDDADVSDADLSGADLYWAYFFRARCVGTNFTGASLQGAVFDLADLTNANLTEANLSYDNLQGSTSLLGTCLRGAILTATKFEGALYDDTTIFPDGFDPHAVGMIRSHVK
jgi:uncharacterized protein YjbI with pentapeptide repeats